MYEDTLDERYSDIPVSDGALSFTDPSYPYDRCIRYVAMPRPVVGEIWDISMELHATNDDLRARDKALALTTEILIGPQPSNSRFTNGVIQLVVLRANGSYNIGPEAHHGLISRRAVIQWDAEKIAYIAAYETIYVKLMAWAISTAAESGDRCEITPNRGFLRVLRYAP